MQAVAERNVEVEACDDLAPDEVFLVFRFLREEMERRGVDLPIVAQAYAHGIWSDVDLMVTMLAAPISWAVCSA